jgi:hypothetical protein
MLRPQLPRTTLLRLLAAFSQRKLAKKADEQSNTSKSANETKPANETPYIDARTKRPVPGYFVPDEEPQHKNALPPSPEARKRKRAKQPINSSLLKLPMLRSSLRVREMR